MKEEYENFVGIYDESVPVELCNEFVKNYELAKKNRTIIDISKEVDGTEVKNDTQIHTNSEEKDYRKVPSLQRKDESIFTHPISSTIYPIRPGAKSYFNYLTECIECYMDKYSIYFDGTLFNDVFKIHKVGKSEGFHQWHYERSDPTSLDRVIVYMTYIESPKKGGETEFLHQSLRIDPVVGRTLVWPAGFTHMHRGNPPLDGEKMYITGWLNASRTVEIDVRGK